MKATTEKPAKKKPASYRISDESKAVIKSFKEESGFANEGEALEYMLQSFVNAKDAYKDVSKSKPAPTKDLQELLAKKEEEIKSLQAKLLTSDESKRVSELTALIAKKEEEIEEYTLKVQAYIVEALNLPEDLRTEYVEFKKLVVEALQKLTGVQTLELTGQDMFTLLLDYAKADPLSKLASIVSNLTDEQKAQVADMQFPRAEAVKPIVEKFLKNQVDDTKKPLEQAKAEETGSAATGNNGTDDNTGTGSAGTENVGNGTDKPE